MYGTIPTFHKAPPILPFPSMGKRKKPKPPSPPPEDPDEELFADPDSPAAVQDQAAFDLMAKDIDQRTKEREQFEKLEEREYQLQQQVDDMASKMADGANSEEALTERAEEARVDAEEDR